MISLSSLDLNQASEPLMLQGSRESSLPKTWLGDHCRPTSRGAVPQAERLRAMPQVACAHQSLAWSPVPVDPPAEFTGDGTTCETSARSPRPPRARPADGQRIAPVPGCSCVGGSVHLSRWTPLQTSGPAVDTVSVPIGKSASSAAATVIPSSYNVTGNTRRPKWSDAASSKWIFRARRI